MSDVSFLMDGVSATRVVFMGVTALSGLAAMAVASTRRPEGYQEPTEQIDWEGYKARIRAENSVRLIEEKETGLPVSELPNGLYGYTYSPSFDNPVPLFSKSSFQCFELHKLANGETVLLGCVTKDAAAKFASGEFLTLQLFPEPYADAVSPIALNYKYVIRSNNKVSRHNGNYIEFDVKTGA
ncbi:MAG: hypothetical protein LC114_27335 [Bryobacterales bacterium]|nr:hypothetical protein [Bryobacterales bacterium]